MDFQIGFFETIKIFPIILLKKKSKGCCRGVMFDTSLNVISSKASLLATCISSTWHTKRLFRLHFSYFYMLVCTCSWLFLFSEIKLILFAIYTVIWHFSHFCICLVLKQEMKANWSCLSMLFLAVFWVPSQSMTRQVLLCTLQIHWDWQLSDHLVL